MTSQLAYFLTRPSVLSSGLQPQATSPYFDVSGYLMGMQDGWTTRDTGTGRNEILDAQGNVLGAGYDDVDTTLREWQRANVMGSAQTQQGEAPFINVPAPSATYYSPYLTEQTPTEDYNLMSPVTTTSQRQFDSQAELDAALEGVLSSSSTLDQVYGTTNQLTPGMNFAAPNRWEALGILSNPGVDQSNQWHNPLLGPQESSPTIYQGASGWGHYEPGTSNHAAAAANFVGLPNTVKENAIGSPASESLSGADALYGSTPMFLNGQLAGYKVDTRLMPPEMQQAITDDYATKESPRFQASVGDYGVSTAKNRESSVAQAALWRELNPGWDQFEKISEHEYFVPVDKVDEVPGWTNHGANYYDNWSQTGITPNMMASAFFGTVLGPILGPQLGAALLPAGTSAGISAAVGGAALGGITSAMGSGDVLQGMALGGLGGFASNSILNSGWASEFPTLGRAASGAASSFIKSKGNPVSALTGAVGAGVGAEVGNATGLDWAGAAAGTAAGILTGQTLNNNQTPSATISAPASATTTPAPAAAATSTYLPSRRPSILSHLWST